MRGSRLDQGKRTSGLDILMGKEAPAPEIVPAKKKLPPAPERAFKGMSRDQFESMCRSVFEKHDPDQSGFLLPGYFFSQLCNDLTKAFTNRKLKPGIDRFEEKEKLGWFKLIDRDGNGQISWDELWANLEQ